MIKIMQNQNIKNEEEKDSQSDSSEKMKKKLEHCTYITRQCFLSDV